MAVDSARPDASVSEGPASAVAAGHAPAEETETAVTGYESVTPPDQRFQYETGQRYAEMNTILGRIRRRRPAEPTTAERERLAVLRAEITVLKRGGIA